MACVTGTGPEALSDSAIGLDGKLDDDGISWVGAIFALRDLLPFVDPLLIELVVLVLLKPPCEQEGNQPCH